MKTIVAFSDSHNRSLPQRFVDILNEADFVFFLGDGLLGVRQFLNSKNFYAVKGNCDYLPYDEEIEFEIEGVKFFLTHGNKYSVKSDMLNITLKAKEVNANCVLFGHTHTASNELVEGINLINPGSITMPRMGNPTYAYITVNKGNMLCKIVEIF